MPIGQYPSMGAVFLLCALFLSALFPLFGTEIRDTLSVEEYLQPDLLEVSVEIATTGRSEGEVLNTLSAVDNGVRTLNLPYKGGRYKVLPRKVWDRENRRYRFEEFSGFSITLRGRTTRLNTPLGGLVGLSPTRGWKGRRNTSKGSF